MLSSPSRADPSPTTYGYHHCQNQTQAGCIPIQAVVNTAPHLQTPACLRAPTFGGGIRIKMSPAQSEDLRPFVLERSQRPCRDSVNVRDATGGGSCETGVSPVDTTLKIFIVQVNDSPGLWELLGVLSKENVVKTKGYGKKSK